LNKHNSFAGSGTLGSIRAAVVEVPASLLLRRIQQQETRSAVRSSKCPHVDHVARQVHIVRSASFGEAFFERSSKEAATCHR
jgi:hypothetical protein